MSSPELSVKLITMLTASVKRKVVMEIIIFFSQNNISKGFIGSNNIFSAHKLLIFNIQEESNLTECNSKLDFLFPN